MCSHHIHPHHHNLREEIGRKEIINHQAVVPIQEVDLGKIMIETINIKREMIKEIMNLIGIIAVEIEGSLAVVIIIERENDWN